MLKIKHKGLKIILLIIIILIIILFGGLFYANHNINTIITERVNSNFEKSEFSNYYTFEFSNLRINILTGTIKFTDVKITPKENIDTMFFYKHGKLDFKIKSFVLKGADILMFIKTDTLFVKNIYVKNPIVNFVKYSEKEKGVKVDMLIQSPFIIVDKLEINNCDLSFQNKINNKNNVFDDINITINNINYNTKKRTQAFSFFNAELNIKKYYQTYKSNNKLEIENAKIKIDKYYIFSDNDTLKYNFNNIDITLKNTSINSEYSVYTISAENFRLDYANKNVSINSIKIKPNINKTEFVKKFNYQKEYFNIELNNINILGLDVDSLVNKKTILANEIIIDGGNLNVYIDKTLSVHEKKRIFPSQQILQFPIRTNINKIIAKNISVKSHEKIDKNTLGQIDVKLNVTVKNITNISKSKDLIIKGDGIFHNTANFTTSLKFSYNKPEFSYNGYIKNFDLIKINSVITSFTPIKVKSGKVKSIKFSGYADIRNSKGKMTFLYNNLKLKITNEEKTKADKYKNKVLSLTANSIILSNNPVKKKPVRTVSFTIERDKTTGFIGYLWKSILEGISKTLLPDKDQINKTKNKLKRKK